MNNRILNGAIALGIIIAVLLSGENTSALSGRRPEAEVKVKIEKEWKGYYCGYTVASRLVIKTEDQWREVWGKVYRFQIPQPKLPKIDFEKEMVIAVFMGVRRSGGYEIKMTEIIKMKEEIVVVVKEREPAPDSIRTMALTQPYHIVVIKRSPLPLRFQNRLKTK